MNKKIRIHTDNPNAQAEVIRPTPQHDRLREVKDRSQSLHEFLLEFCSEKGVQLSAPIEGSTRPYPVSEETIKNLIAEFLEIDLNELENEKRRMLIDIRVESARRDAERELPMFGKKD